MNKLILYANKYYQGKTVDELYRKTQLSSIPMFLDFIDDKGLRLADVTPKDANDFVAYLKEKISRRGGYMSNSRINDVINAVNSGYNELVKHEEVLFNPFSSVKRLTIDKITNAYGSHVLDIGEVSRLFTACETMRERVIIHLFYSIGARRSEAGRVLISDINFQKKEVILKGKRANGEIKKRIVPVPSEVMDEIQEYVFGERVELLNNRESNYLIVSRLSLKSSGGSMYTSLLEIAERECFDKKVLPHILRASFGTHCINAGMKPAYVQLLLGHENLDTTNIYINQNER